MYKMVVAVIRHSLLEKVAAGLKQAGVHFTYSEVKGFGEEVRLYHEDIHDRIKIEIIADEKNIGEVKRIVGSDVPHGTAGSGIMAVMHIDEFTDFSHEKDGGS